MGKESGLDRVAALLPKRVKKRRPIQTQDGTSAGIVFIFLCNCPCECVHLSPFVVAVVISFSLSLFFSLSRTHTHTYCCAVGLAGWEEYYDYIFPDEQIAQPNLKLLEKARAWKAAMASATTTS